MDWDSKFGGPAWERITEPDGMPGQWYLHLFAKEQPDFNWDNEEVRADFLRTLRFWSDRGVDGFRIDVAHALVKDLSEPLPSKAELPQEGTGVDGLPDGSMCRQPVQAACHVKQIQEKNVRATATHAGS